MTNLVEKLQPLGRALMLPIAVLPVAGLLLRLGQPDLLDIAFVSAAGDAIFAHLGLLFAVGVAAGFARDGNGAACLAGLVCFLVAERGAAVFVHVPADALKGFSGDGIAIATDAYKQAALAKIDVPIGIISGLVGGNFYNRFSAIALPEYLAFFGGRRFVPIVSGLAGLVIAAVLGLGYGAISDGIDAASRTIVDAGPLGLFVYGVLNRLLLVTGLHHIINNVVWFVVGDYHGATGDLRRFFAGDPSAGAFMSGFFPIMMFGLPAACLAMYHEARADRRKAVAGMLFSLALTAFLTGVTEPIEFTFIFLAPVLYAIHAVLTGLSMALMPALGVHLGFGFSAGLFDYVLNYGKSTRPLLLLPVGLAYFAIYYGLFRVVIRRLDLATPGREKDGVDAPETAPPSDLASRGARYLAALGGPANIVSVDACTTRLRLVVADQSAIDEPALKSLGARGVLKPSRHALQIVLGPVADMVSVEIRDAMAAMPQAERPTPATVPEGPRDAGPGLANALVAALGGAGNVEQAAILHGRLRAKLRHGDLVQQAALDLLGARGLVTTDDGVTHVLFDPASPLASNEMTPAGVTAPA
ncbi:PTS N-acetyl-D-glucosamine transporter [Sphingomonas koreensis]|nr:PTS N-acetyl-D-glucosamine transporter [Sphingomonas koreensis]